MWDERMRHYSFRRFLHRTLRHSVWLYSQFLGSSLGTPGTFGTKPIHLTTKYDEERLAFLDSSFLRGSYGSSNKKSWLCSILFQSMQDSAWAREKRREKHETLSACSNWTSIYIYFILSRLHALCHVILRDLVVTKSNRWLSCEIQYLSLWWKHFTRQFFLVLRAG